MQIQKTRMHVDLFNEPWRARELQSTDWLRNALTVVLLSAMSLGLFGLMSFLFSTI